MADNNIIFIGMPAVGKSTVGVVIAKRLGYKFVDTDILIQESEGKLLKDIIADVGPDVLSISHPPQTVCLSRSSIFSGQIRFNS